MLGLSGNSPFDLRWRMFGIPVRIQVSFWIFSLLFGFHYLQLRMYARFGVWVGVMLFSFFFKELGHVIMGRIFGVRGGILLHAFGGSAVGDYAAMRRWQRVVFYAMGPLFSLTLWAIATEFQRHSDWLAHLGQAENNVRYALVDLMRLNLFWALINLMPIYPLDGGMIVRELCEAVAGRKGLIFSLVLSLTCAAGLAAYSGYAIYNPAVWHWGYPLFSLIFDAMLALENLSLLIKVLRERPSSAADEHEDSRSHYHDTHELTANQPTEHEPYRPFDGGRPDDPPRR